MFVTLNEIIKWMIIFLLIEVLMVSIFSLFKINLQKNSNLFDLKRSQNSYQIQYKFDKIISTYDSSKFQDEFNRKAFKEIEKLNKNAIAKDSEEED